MVRSRRGNRPRGRKRRRHVFKNLTLGFQRVMVSKARHDGPAMRDLERRTAETYRKKFLGYGERVTGASQPFGLMMGMVEATTSHGPTGLNRNALLKAK